MLATSPDNEVRKQGETVGSNCHKGWCFEVVASIRSKQSSSSSDAIAAIDFDESGSRFATGGIARKIRVCSYSYFVNCQVFEEDEIYPHALGDDFQEERDTGPAPGSRRKICNAKSAGFVIENDDKAALRVICTPAKLSSLKWRPQCANVICCGDYDGVVTEWDVEQGICLSERYEHSGQRIWSVDYSTWYPLLCASASGEGTVRIWTHNSEKSVGVIRSPNGNSICCAEFSSREPHSVAVACADSQVYLYDLRRLDSCLLCLQGHRRAASYVRFLNEKELVSSSIDSTARLWDVSDATISNRDDIMSRTRLVRTFDSHKNKRNFVGLSVLKTEGLIASGSESNEMFVYGRWESSPLWRMKLPLAENFRNNQRLAVPARIDDDDDDDDEGENHLHIQKPFVGAVCWKEQIDHYSLIAANSEGTVQVVKLSPKSSPYPCFSV